MSQPRFVVVGAGAIGGVVGARLHQAGHEVHLVARGAHGDAIAREGLLIEDPIRSERLDVEVVADASLVAYRPDDIVLLSVKTQDTMGALSAIRAGGGAGRPIVCLQNGVANEPMALRISPSVYGVAVMCPGVHLTPGVVQSFSAPVSGLLDIGRYPAGVPDDEGVAAVVSAAFNASTFLSDVVDDIERAKFSKLLLNLGNAIEVVCGPGGAPDLFAVVHAEGRSVLESAGIGFDEGADPRREQMRMQPIGGQRREGGSSWQSVARGTGSVETDYLSGEIVMQARRIGSDAPANRLLQELAAGIAAGAHEPGSFDEHELLDRLGVR